jgi:hypothetical protein
MADEYVSIKSAMLLASTAQQTSKADNFIKQDAVEAAEIKKKRTFRKFSYRGIDLDQYAYPIHTH